MYIEDQYIQEQFRKNFIEQHQGNIVIYGTGIHTKLLLEKIKSDRIVGLMDAAKTGEVLYGKKVLSYEEVRNIEEVYIVILARNAVINIIYRRIEMFCKQNKIAVFDIQGNNLGINAINTESYPCFLQKESELKKEIETHDIISFDIFDTLLTRKLMRPRDLFLVMDEKVKESRYLFSKERMRAEEDLGLKSNPTIYEIYSKFQENVGISEQEKQKLLLLEIETEKQFLVVRQKMCELLSYALAIGKHVCIISDMYFPKSILEELLAEFGIKGYAGLFVSCEYRKTKQEGLFEEYLKCLNEAQGKKKFLHIGDNYYADIIAAKTYGIDAYRVYSVQECLEYSIYNNLISQCSTLEDNILISNFAAEAYNNPFRFCQANGKLNIKNTEEVIQLFIAPIIFKYLVWFVQNIKKNNCDFVFFPSRDGYLFKILYDNIKEQFPKLQLPRGEYIYTSRRSTMIAAAKRTVDVQNIVQFAFDKDKEELFRKRFGIEISNYMGLEDKTVNEIAEKLMPEILKQCKQEREDYIKYLEKFEISSYQKIAFMDFVAMGTVQEAIEHIIDKKLEGYYFLRRRNVSKEYLKCYSLYSEAGDFQIDANVYKYYYFLETIITSFEPSFWGMNSCGQKQFYPESRSNETLALLQRVHNAIVMYCKDMLKIMPNIMEMEAKIELYDMLLGFFSADYSILESDELNNLINIDEFMGKIIKELNR